MSDSETPMINSEEALERLQMGNQRFVSGESRYRGLQDGQLDELAQAQRPFAIVLGCSDSRVPAELVFDQGLGDLFVIRVAGNIAAPSQIGSVEFAAATFETPLVVVLGHSSCGVIQACVQELRREAEVPSESLATIVDRVKPCVEPLLSIHDGDDHALHDAATRKNVLASVAQLKAESEILRDLIAKKTLNIVGAHYSLATGVVDFFS